MIYQALYRAYRPQAFSEMSGQQAIKQTLQNTLLHQKTTHAYLFSGPRGTGKTSAAKIFAKALNCENGPAAEPCNECETCRSITEGSNTDVTEFDAASNSRVEEIRDIIERVHVAPSNARFKVYIIDEVHMLSNSAFNALLKTLEEPPAHVVFILATTEPHKLPLTIISRCQRFDFKPITAAEITDRMKQVLSDIDVKAEDGALRAIAQAATGGMRDALSMLDQAISFSGEELTTDDALLVTGAISEEIFYQLAQAIQAKDAGTALSLLHQLIAEGKDVGRLAEDMITFFRDILLLGTAPELTDLLELISDGGKFKELAQAFHSEELYRYIDILSKTQQEMRFSNHGKVYVESALLKMIHSGGQQQAVSSQPADPEMSQKLAVLEQTVRQLQQQLAAGPVQQASAEPQAPARRAASSASRSAKVPTGKIVEVLKAATKPDIQMIREQWAGMMQNLQRSHAALLDDAEPVAASETAFVLKFKYEIHCLMASEHATLQADLSTALLQMTGKGYEVIYVAEESWLKVRQDFIQKNGLASQQNQDSSASSDEEQQSASAFMEEVTLEEADPFVAEAERLFGKDFITIEDD
ncbi:MULTISPECIES: DNA polymerase III subunit gamma/tau [unclassified Sporosarcina]|uniref:DNA polymerase III subunit gamma/tau n=1 Tax=unclassified Sporosarcina TaxID=2647733 RepID=UPI00203F58F2|nr:MULTISPECIES: DNA polymerase III subunit gamma/tau [unclassified Sporosarcina]GKV67230.1 DNA polymerase III subunit gamma/tau [Sporosarcina sp. NCCP-2331]GLB57586.1 DNA polymerase III subunit gamma/tau [Sporosarcina sp. NCCP-2378]